MKAAAVLSLLVAIVLGIVAFGNYVDDSARREKVLKDSLAEPERLGSPVSDYRDQEIEKAETAQFKDECLALSAITFLIASLAMFSQAKKMSASE